MIPRPLVYIAAPIRAESEALMRWNINRAMLLARFAFLAGYQPVTVHPLALFGVCREDNPEERAAALAGDLELVRTLATNPRAELWALERHDGSLSEGVGLEVEQWMLSAPAHSAEDVPRMARSTWSGWWQEVERRAALTPWLGRELAGLAGMWHRLEAPPIACKHCGCTEDCACEGGCCWVEPDVCCACADVPSCGCGRAAEEWRDDDDDDDQVVW